MTVRPTNPTEPLERALALTQGILPSAPSEVATLDVYAFQMFGRALRLARGAKVLLQAHMAEEALFLGRSLFEDSLRLSDLAVTPTFRHGLLLRWAYASLNEARGLARTAVEAGLEKDPDSWLEMIENERKRLSEYAARNGAIKPRKFRSVRDAAHAYGRQESLWTYSLAHEMVHGSDLAFLFNRRKPEKGMVAIHISIADPDLEIGVACFCADALLHAAVAFAEIFGRPGSDELRAMISEIADLQDKLVATKNP